MAFIFQIHIARFLFYRRARLGEIVYTGKKYFFILNLIIFLLLYKCSWSCKERHKNIFIGISQLNFAIIADLCWLCWSLHDIVLPIKCCIVLHNIRVDKECMLKMGLDYKQLKHSSCLLARSWRFIKLS